MLFLLIPVMIFSKLVIDNKNVADYSVSYLDNIGIWTIQELLGHSDVRTKMIYTHTIKSRTLKEVASPLDFDSKS